ncbi:MAG: metal-dependent hydrolase [Actinobacteria bacterium]|nr:metal-dependent hydrolase [Actinomycetota bacterium]
MLFWHLGATLWLFRWIFKDPIVDVRFLLLGAILPDLVDLPIGTVLLAARFSTGELWLHSLLLATIYMTAVLLLTRRGRRRRAYMALGVGWLLHLMLDGLWLSPEILFWPFFGWEIAAGEAPYWPLAWERALSDPWRWVQEVIGLGYLTWLYFAVGLNRKERRVKSLKTGRLPSFVADDA